MSHDTCRASLSNSYSLNWRLCLCFYKEENSSLFLWCWTGILSTRLSSFVRSIPLSWLVPHSQLHCSHPPHLNSLCLASTIRRIEANISVCEYLHRLKLYYCYDQEIRRRLCLHCKTNGAHKTTKIIHLIMVLFRVFTYKRNNTFQNEIIRKGPVFKWNAQCPQLEMSWTVTASYSIIPLCTTEHCGNRIVAYLLKERPPLVQLKACSCLCKLFLSEFIIDIHKDGQCVITSSLYVYKSEVT